MADSGKKQTKKLKLYAAPTPEIRERYKAVFALTEPLPDRTVKVVFDKVVTLPMLLLVSPLVLLIVLMYLVEGLIFPENRGPFLAPYVGASGGKKFMKLKFRLAKYDLCPEHIKQSKEFYGPYHSQKKNKHLTYTGRFIKKFYLDELPQLWSVFIGDMSLVGPRPLAWEDYCKDIARGNVSRKILKGGIFSQTHVRKGTSLWSSQDLEYGYVERYMTASAPALLWLDICIIARGFRMILEGKGL